MNDERPIEKLLRRYAQKRRDEAGAPAELHPANRRALQAEVARQYPKAEKCEGWWASLSQLLNRKLAYAVAVVAVIALGVALLPTTKQNEPMGLAALDVKPATESELPSQRVGKSDAAPTTLTAEAKDSFAAAPAVAATPPVPRTESALLAADSLSPASEINSATPQSALPAPAPASRTRSVSTSAAEADRTALRRKQVAESVARYNEQVEERAPARADASTMSPASGRALAAGTTKGVESADAFARRYGVGAPATMPGSIPAVQPAMTGSATAELAKSVQNFSQVSAGDRSRSGPTASAKLPVLVNFVVEQSGDQIRVTDSDGSTYTGAVQFASQENVGQKEFMARGGLEKSALNRVNYDTVGTDTNLADHLNSQNLFFKVSGTNRTLKQQVNFVGSFVTLSNQAVNTYGTIQAVDKAKNSQSQWNFTPLLQNSAIQGQLQIGSGREMQLNALPVQK